MKISKNVQFVNFRRRCVSFFRLIELKIKLLPKMEIPLKNSPSQTMLAGFPDEEDGNLTTVGDSKDTTVDETPTSNNFEALYQQPGSSSGATQNPKLLDSIVEIVKAEETLRRVSEEKIDPGYDDEEDNNNTDVWNVTEGEAGDIAENIIFDMEGDLTDILKYRDIGSTHLTLPEEQAMAYSHFKIPDPMDARYYI
ncbi:uncharacterized protein LOC118436628 [Folsomia candida]|uniref:uncharacterized protein LOC118436628 n=1 Tax=Folsomia candida TaxID=158441 RepID=UPI001604A67B|nr:uncharacterized protein LOC118436628 [Folsomia candida]